MMMLVNCSGCRTALQLPPGAKSIRCAICQTITPIADPRDVPAPPHHPHSHGSAPTPPAPSSSPSPYQPAPPSPHGRKKAVICGISYRFSRHELKGCINDAKCMKYLLINRFHFPESSIIMLTEEETDPYKSPTKNNIRMALFWLVQGCQPGDSLVFHYSGHGSRQRNYNGDEVDGYDETLCPLDFERQGMIVDDEINAAIVRPLPRGVKLHAIIDACHSGTVLDLPFLCRMNRYSIWLDSKLRLQSDPFLILEYFLWRKGYEYAISNHYDRHCVWEEVIQNKKLNKFNHTVIDQQFTFYQADGLRRFDPSDANKLLPSYVPEGSFIIRAHTPMSNLFSCLWFNEVDRFTPRDQLSFAYTYLKLRRMNLEKPFRLNMFKDCERRSIAKLFHHRAEDKRNIQMQATG